jgi:quinolinate synthase
MRIVLCYPVEAHHIARIQAAAPEAMLVDAGQERVAEELPTADLFCGHPKVPVPWERVVSEGRLRWIQSSAAGLDHCLVPPVVASDIIVTSSSAETILQQIPPEQKIIFGPDRHLGGYLSRKFNREMLLWPGVCIVHEAFSETELMKLKAQHPGAPVAAHPECPPAIIDHADYVGSTSGILQFAKTFPGNTLIVATEPHIIHQMEKAIPDKQFIGAPGADGNCNCNICPYMALNTLEKLYLALRDLEPRVEIEEGLRLQAKKSLDRMLEMASGTVGKGDLGAR